MPGNELLWPTENALAVPPQQVTNSIKLWTDYAVWGLDIYDNQPTWFSLIELILVLTDRHRKGGPLLSTMTVDDKGKPVHENIQYDIYYNANLRHLMFRDQDILPLSERNATDQPALWADWLARVRKDFHNLDLSYLQTAFADDFNKFSEAVDLLRSAEVEPMHAKRWTSRHLQPIGEAVLFPDYASRAGGGGDLDRRFFRRTGEIFYLMMSRSAEHLKEKLEELLKERLFSSSNHWNAIAKKLQGPEANLENSPKITAASFAYLPQPKLERYDRLSEDWINILRHRSIPLEDALDYLMRMSGLNEIIYVIERAAKASGINAAPVFYLDMLGAAQGNHVRLASIENYKIHKNLTKKAVEAYIQSFFETEEWASLGASAIDCGIAQSLLKGRFLFATSHSAAHPVSKAIQAQELLEAAGARSHTIGSAYTAHSRQIGLLSMKQGVGGWYSPTDSFLEALVIANVDGTTEFKEFLRKIYQRYGFVVGSEEAKKASNTLPAPGEAMVANERRFEERLRVLGFIDRKSDDCAFVINPFSDGSSK
ncbi:hypothetical protein G6L35_05965 [Agrobacterium tumefaciens]|uniref:hypothetical protein n=1 Tax=Agrobacterium tumefaciens TaxID=358 RepID=UPI001572FDCB|nr:hypothetical protein [Agrobacterium tumefaciens]NSZ68172.1 hypothetical protein [Agrobacterium tumefaciens]